MPENNLPKSFETERLLLKPTTEEDAAFLFELMNSPKWLQNIGDRKIRTIADAENYIRERIYPQLKKLGYASFTVIRKNDRVKMGVCGIYDRAGLEGVDIGFAFLSQFEGQGYAYESATKIRDAAFSVWEIEVIQAITIPANIPSRKLLVKLGFHLVGNTTLPGDDEELLLFRLRNEAS